MAISGIILRRLIIRGARIASPTDPISVLEAIVAGSFTFTITNGKAIMKTEGNGQKVEFGVPGGITESEIMQEVEPALTWLESQSDPTDVTQLPRTIKRLQASFLKARV